MEGTEQTGVVQVLFDILVEVQGGSWPRLSNERLRATICQSCPYIALHLVSPFSSATLLGFPASFQNKQKEAIRGLEENVMPWFYGADEKGDRDADGYILEQFEAKGKSSALVST